MAESAAAANRNAAECGGVMTPALRASAQPLPLTVREREIANLVAAGLSNKQIAERLFVSPHTINSHLRHVFLKLGITSRVELARVARDYEIA